jgi:hypothetical protein
LAGGRADDLSVPQHGLGVGVCLVDPRATEGPTGAGGHVDPEPETLCLAPRVLEHFHPFGREKIKVAALVTLGAVDRSDFNAPDAGRGDVLEVGGEARSVDPASGPPPAGPRLVFLGDFRPAQIGVRRVAERQAQAKNRGGANKKSGGFAEGAHGES